MSDTPPNPELLRALCKLVRGLSALFWGLPAALIVCAGTAVGGWFRAFSIAPAMLTTGLILYGLWQIGAFQKQEYPWRVALDRARLVALVNFGLSPFLYWWNRMPDNPFFTTVVGLLAVTSLLFLFNLNHVIARLGEMIPDEMLRQETRQFTMINRSLLVLLLVIASGYVFLLQMPNLPGGLIHILIRLQHIGQPVVMLLVLLPLSLTMSLLWKTKEVIMDSLFTHR
ncbi:MAG: hypothetical protein DVB33_04460 [Verrucomicrobia bacterium]|jgi:hypothetical protein|nr:MAG: hypothetical protein DVB33_04460 [Verrucomicrobiota bacterium]